MKSMSNEDKRRSPLLMERAGENMKTLSLLTSFNLDILKVSIFQHQLLGHPY